jgi:hypothetical protein
MPTKSSGIIFESRRFFGSDPGTLYEDVSREQATCTPTALDYTELASGLWVPTWNGSTTKVDTGSDWVPLTDISASMWLYLIGWGEGPYGRILNNGSFDLSVNGDTGRILLTADGGTFASSAVISLTTWLHLFITRTSAGVSNFYVNGALSNTANQAGGTPTVGSTNLIVGNNNATDRTSNGYIDGFEFLSYIDADSPGLASNIFATERNLYGV